MDFPPSVCHELMVEKRLPTHVRAPLVIKPFLVLFMVSVCDISWAGRFEGIYFPRCQCRTSDQQSPSETASLALSCLPRSCHPSPYQPFLLSSFVCSCCPCLFVCLLLFKAAVGRVETGSPRSRLALDSPPSCFLCLHPWFLALSHPYEEMEAALVWLTRMESACSSCVR